MSLLLSKTYRPFFSLKLTVFLLLLGLTLCVPHRVQAADAALSEEALVDLVKPSVVRIGQHVWGSAKIAAIKVDIRRGLVATIPNKFTEVPVDEYLSGSGFIISPDGYIATNAHVASQGTIKVTLASESALSAIFENALILSDEEMQSFLDDQSSQSFSRQVVQYVIDHSEFHLQSQLAVLRPGSKETKFSSLLENGLPAEIVSLNEDFITSERDVALLKVQETNLPALSLGDADELSVGKKAYIFGFPATAEVNANNPLEATFTQGVVSAIKQSTDGSFKIFQTDAKVSQGSSGGPLLNEKGEVVGIITFQTTELSRTSGDNFAFALPITLVKEEAVKANIQPQEGRFGNAFKKGFEAYIEKHCDDAATFFDQARDTNSNFFVEDSLRSFEEKCQQLKMAGGSIDTYWERVGSKAQTLGKPLLYILGAGFFFLGIFGAALFWLLRQLRRDEREIAILERRIMRDEMRIVRYEDGAFRPRDHRAAPATPPKKKIG